MLEILSSFCISESWPLKFDPKEKGQLLTTIHCINVPLFFLIPSLDNHNDSLGIFCLSVNICSSHSLCLHLGILKVDLLIAFL